MNMEGLLVVKGVRKVAGGGRLAKWTAWVGADGAARDLLLYRSGLYVRKGGSS